MVFEITVIKDGLAFVFYGFETGAASGAVRRVPESVSTQRHNLRYRQ